MADETTEYPTYTDEQRKAGISKLVEALTKEDIKTSPVERVTKKGNLYLGFIVLDAAGVPTAEYSVNGKGFINLEAIYTDGGAKDRRAAASVIAEANGGKEVTAGKFTKAQAKPGAGGFLARL